MVPCRKIIVLLNVPPSRLVYRRFKETCRLHLIFFCPDDGGTSSYVIFLLYYAASTFVTFNTSVNDFNFHDVQLAGQSAGSFRL